MARPFAYGADPFRAGWHRGADFAAAPGARVGAACSGRVVWAGRDVVTVRCGSYRVTHLPLASVAVAGGARVRAGARIGTVGRSREHAGLHVGVRRAGDRFGYVDPVPLLADPRRRACRRRREWAGRRRGPSRGAEAAPRPCRAPRARRRRAARRAPPAAAPRAASRAAPPCRAAAARGAAAAAPPPPAAPRVARPLPAGPAAAVRVLAPWPAWLGLAVLLAGAVGGGVRIGLRRRRATAAVLARR